MALGSYQNPPVRTTRENFCLLRINFKYFHCKKLCFLLALYDIYGFIQQSPKFWVYYYDQNLFIPTKKAHRFLKAQN
jgi:hypothetical protein